MTGRANAKFSTPVLEAAQALEPESRARFRLDVQGHSLTIANHHRRHLAAGRCLLHQSRELSRASHTIAVELHDDVPFAHPAFCRGTFLGHILDHGSRRRRQPGPLQVFVFDFSHRNAEAAASTNKNRRTRKFPSRDSFGLGLPVNRRCHNGGPGGDPGQGHHTRGCLENLHNRLPTCLLLKVDAALFEKVGPRLVERPEARSVGVTRNGRRDQQLQPFARVFSGTGIDVHLIGRAESNGVR